MKYILAICVVVMIIILFTNLDITDVLFATMAFIIVYGVNHVRSVYGGDERKSITTVSEYEKYITTGEDLKELTEKISNGDYTDITYNTRALQEKTKAVFGDIPGLLDPRSLYGAYDPPPKDNASELEDMSYHDKVMAITTKHKLNQDDAAKPKLIQAMMEYRRRNLVSAIISGDFDQIFSTPAACYYYVKTQRKMYANPTFDIYTFFTPGMIRRLLKDFKTPENDEHPETSKLEISPPLGVALGQIFVHTNPQFNDFVVLPKTAGKEAGFILEKGGERYYAKYTYNAPFEFVISWALVFFGIKMPEAQLITDAAGNQCYISRDLSREYSGKVKKFTPFQAAITSKYAYGLADDADESVKAELTADINKLMSTEKTRVSFAKLLIMATACGLSDFGTHGGNTGPLVTTGAQNWTKMGIVDFQVYLNEDSKKDVAAIKSIREYYINMFKDRSPLYSGLIEKLTPADIQKAVEQLRTPKLRKIELGISRKTGEFTTIPAVIAQTEEYIKNACPDLKITIKYSDDDDNEHYKVISTKYILGLVQKNLDTLLANLSNNV